MVRTYRVNSPRVIHENIDGEMILVHMERGTYYSTDDVGATLLGLIEARCSFPQMQDALQAEYDASPEEIGQAVSAFLGRLLEEDLVTVEELPAEGAIPQSSRSWTRRPFRSPVLQAYRDMQDMLSLDPIHDVEAAGWPVPKLDADPSESSA